MNLDYFVPYNDSARRNGPPAPVEQSPQINATAWLALKKCKGRSGFRPRQVRYLPWAKVGNALSTFS